MTKHASRFQRLPIPAAIAGSLAGASLLLPGLALAGPSGGVVVGGSGTISNPTSTSTVINQTSNSAIINWQQFSIGGNEYVQFVMPSSSSVVLNRVIGGSPSQILGNLAANGRVFLINPNGVLFGAGSRVDVGGLVASTLSIKDSDFLAGRYVFSGGSAPGSSVVNAGTIKTADGGFVVLAGDYVKNTGVIASRLGQVVLASGSATTLDIGNSGLVSVKVDKETLAQKAGVDNAGQIIADGGRVIMTAKTAHDLAGSAVNNSGLIRAQGIASHNGEIELTASGGDITDSGTLDTSNANGAGGTVKIAGDRDIDIQSGAQILASGTTQGGNVSIVAERNLSVRDGTLIDTHGAGAQGGKVELSGHNQLTMRGDVNAGNGGTLLIDPTSIVIANGAGSTTSSGGTETVSENFIEGQLQSGTNVQLVASSSIVMQQLTTDGTLNGINASGGYGGSLLLGIGSVNGSNQYVEGPGGTITFLDVTNTIATYGGLKIDAGATSGMVNVGKLIGGDITVIGGGGIKLNTANTSNGGITLTSASGDISATSLSTTINGSNGNESSSIVVSAGGGVSIGTINSGASNGGSLGGNADASVHIDSNTADLGHAVSIGAITVGASSQLSGSATASVDIVNHSTSAKPVNVALTGAVATGARGSNGANSHVTITNNAGGITATSAAAIETVAVAGNGSFNDDINLTSYNGGALTLGSLITGGGAVNLNANGSGAAITVASLNGLPSYGGLGAVTINSAGSLAFSVSGNITATSIRLSSTTGNLTVGNLTTTAGIITLNDSSGNIVAGDLSAANNNDVGSSSAYIQAYSGGSLTVGSVTTSTNAGAYADSHVDLEANANSQNGGDLIVGGPINVYANTGGTNGYNANASVYLRNNKGNIQVGTGTPGMPSFNAAGITTRGSVAGTSTFNGNIDLHTYGTGGNINAGNLSALGSAITISAGGGTTGAGNIALGTLDGGSYGGVASSINIGAAGTFSTANTSVTAGSVTLSAGSGNLSFAGGIAATSGNVSITASGGNISLGALSGGSLYANAAGSLTISSAVTAQQIRLNAGTGALTTNNLTTTNGYITLNDSGGNIVTGNLSATGSSATGSANAYIQAYSGGSLTVGSVTTNATVTGTTGYADGHVDLEANANSQNGGDLIVGGPINSFASTSATNGYSANASVYLRNNKGNIYVGTGTPGTASFSAANITTQGSAAGTSTLNGNIDLHTYGSGGNIDAANLSARNSAITISASSGATGAGNITVGTLDGGSYGGVLSNVNIGSVGTFTTANTSITAGSITLSAGSGNLSFAGGLAATSGNVSVTAGGGNINLGALSGGSLYANASGALTIGSAVTAQQIRFYAGTGALTTNNLTTTNGYISLNDSGNSIVTGDLSATASSATGSANGYIQANSGGSLTVGSVTTNATVTGTAGYADGHVDLEANANSQNGGDLIIGGPISTVASTTATNGYSANASVYLRNNKGNVQVGTGIPGMPSFNAAGITTRGSVAGTSTFNGNIDLHTYGTGGNINAGNLSALNSALAISAASGTTGAGNIALGTLDGGTAAGNQLSNVNIGAAGTFGTANSNITAGSITLSAGSGNLSFGGGLAATNGNVSVTAGGGDIKLGALSGGSLYANASGALTIGSAVTAQQIRLSAGGGALTTNNLTSTNGYIYLNDNSAGIVTGNLSATGSSATGSANGYIQVFSGAGLQVGSVTTHATVTGTSGYANGYVQLYANYNSQNGGDLVVTGPINTFASTTGTNYNADASVFLRNTSGNIMLGTVVAPTGITTRGSANGSGTFNGNVDLHVYGNGGNINAGNLSTLDSTIYVTSTSGAAGAGNIVLGTLDGGTAAGDQLASVNLNSAGSLTVGSPNITAGTIILDAASGALSFGSLTSTGSYIQVNNSGGTVNLGALSAGTYIDLRAGGRDTNGLGLNTGNLTANNGTIYLNASTGSIVAGNLSASASNAGTTANAYIQAFSGGSLTVGSVTTHATATGTSGYGEGWVDLEANANSQNGGDLIIGGPINTFGSTSATNYGADAYVYLRNNKGNILVGSVATPASITTAGNANGTGTFNGSIDLHTYGTGGNITAGNLSALNSVITVSSTNGASGTGNVVLGTVDGGTAAGDELSSINLNSAGSLKVGSPNITAGTITLDAASGALSFGSLTSTGNYIQVNNSGGTVNLGALSAATYIDLRAGGRDATGLGIGTGNLNANNGTIYLNAATGNIVAGNLSATASNAGSTANAYIQAFSGGSLTVGSVTTHATATGTSGYADGWVDLEANSNSQQYGGDLVVGGPISTFGSTVATNYGTDAHVYLRNNRGNILVGSAATPAGITTSGSANGTGFFNGDVDLHTYSYGGNITAGNLSALNSAINITSTSGTGGAGNITLGTLDGGSATGDQITSLYLTAAGSLSFSGNPVADSITLSAGAGSLSFGALTATNGNIQVSDTGGDINGGAITTQSGSITVNAYTSNVVLGSLSATDLTTAASANANIRVYSGGGLKVGSVTTDAEVSGASGYADGSVGLYANYNAQKGGTLVLTGPISTKAVTAASGYSADGSVYLNNASGGISGSGESITTLAGGSSFNANIDLHSYVTGGIDIGALTATNGTISLSSGGTASNITVGPLSGGTAPGNALVGVTLDSAGALDAGSGAITAGSITLYSRGGGMTFGNLTASNGNVALSANGGAISAGSSSVSAYGGHIAVDDYTGDISLGNLYASNSGSGGVDAGIGVYSGGGLSVGSVTTSAVSTGTGQTAYGNVNLSANYHASAGGDLVISGPINTSASAGPGSSYGNAGVVLYNGAGAIDATAAPITTSGSGGTHNGAIGISTGQGGAVTTGSLTATNDSITVTTGSGTLGAGNITVGTLSGGAGSTDALTSVYLTAGGSLTVNSNIVAPQVTLGSSAGGITAQNVTVTNDVFSVTANGGDLKLGNVSANGYISLTANGGGINTGDLTALNDKITADTSSGTGNIVLGHLSGGSGPNDVLTGVGINSGGSLIIGSVDTSGTPTALYDVTAGSISLSANGSTLSTGNLTTTAGNLYLYNGTGNIVAGNLTTVDNNLHSGSDATINATAYGGISVGSISTTAQSGGSIDGGSTASYAYVTMTAYGGDINISGPIVTNANNQSTNGYADGSVQLTTAVGAITATDITASAFSNSTQRGNITLSATSGNVKTGALTAIDGAGIGVSTSGSGDITVGQLSASNGGELSIVSLDAAGSLSNGSTDITGQQISLTARHGDLTVGNITNTLYGLNISDYGGLMTLGDVHSMDGGLTLYDTAGASSGGIHAGNLTSADNIFITTKGTITTGAGADVKTGTLTNNSGGSLGTLQIDSSGGIDIGGSGHLATSADFGITLTAGNGAITTGNLTATDSIVNVTGNNGAMTLGTVIAGSDITLANTSGAIDTQDLTSTGGYNVKVTTTGSGDITLGTVSGASNGSFASVMLNSAGALKIGVNGTKHGDITASQIGLSAGNGDLSGGNITSTGFGNALVITDSNGKITLAGNVVANGNVTLTDDTGGIDVKAVQANHANASVTITATGSGAGIALDSVSGGGSSAPLSSVSIGAGGALTLRVNKDITAGTIGLNAGAGSMSVGNLDALTGPITLGNTGGAITATSLTAATDVGVNASGAVTVNGLLSLGNNGNNGALNITGTSVLLQDIANNSPLAGTGTANDMHVTASAGDIGFGNVTTAGLGSVGLTLNASGAITGHSVNLEVLNATAGGNITLDTLTLNSLTPSGPGLNNLSSTGGSVSTLGIVTNHGLNVTAHTGVTIGAASNVAGILHLSSDGGAIGTQALTATGGGDIQVTDTGGAISTGALTADTNITLTASGQVTVGGATSLGNNGNLGALNVTGTGVTMQDIADNGPLTNALSANDLTITATSGNIKLGAVKTPGVSTSFLTLTASHGTVDTKDLTIEGVNIQAGGNVTLGTLTLDSLVPTQVTGSTITSTGGLVKATGISSDHVMSVSGNQGLNLGAVDTVGALQLSAAGGSIVTLGLTTTGDVTVSNSAGSVGLGNVVAGSGNISVTATGTGSNLTVGTLSATSTPGTGLNNVKLLAGGSLSAATTDITAGNITLGAGAGAMSFGALNATGGPLSVVNSGGSLKTGGLTTSGKLTLGANGSLNVGAISAGSVDALSSNGAATYQGINSTGVVKLETDGGNLTTGAVTANQFLVTADTGNVTVGDLVITGSNFNFALGDHAGQTLDIASLGYAAPGTVTFAYTNANLTLGDVTVGGGFSATLGNGNLQTGAVHAAAGDIDLTATHGSLGIGGDLSGTNVALITGKAFSLSGHNVTAANGFSLSTGGDTSISTASIDAGTSASITSGGKLGISNSSVLAPSVTLNASGDIAISGNSLVGESSYGGLSTLVAHASTTQQVAITSSGGNVSVDGSAVKSAGALTVNGNDISLSNGAALSGNQVALTGTGAVASGAGTSTIDAGALSVRGASIDFTSAKLTVGNGSAAFGSDAQLLASIRAKDPNLAPSSSGPNASFSGTNGVKLGQLSIAGGYLFIQAPSLSLPTALSGNSNMFVDYLPTNTSALLQVNLPATLNGVTTLVFGGSTQTGNIQIGDGKQNFKLTNPNLVFATQGDTLYPDTISSNGVVLVLGNSILSQPPVTTPITDLPLTPDQYDVDQPDTGVLAYNDDQGDINDPGVNDANKGRIDIKTSTQTLSCGIGGSQ